MLGPALEEFGPEWRLTAMIAGAGSVVCLVFYGVAHELKNDVTAWSIFFALTVAILGVLLQQAGFRVWVHESGVSWRGILAEGEMRWGEIEQVYFSSYRVRGPYHIPLGTYYRLKLVNTQGKQIAIGERVRRTEVLLVWIQQRTREAMLAKATGLFASGAEVGFGPVRVSRADGVTLKRWRGKKTIRWEEIESFAGQWDGAIGCEGADVRAQSVLRWSCEWACVERTADVDAEFVEEVRSRTPTLTNQGWGTLRASWA
jgi:hypothetical protein